MKTELLVQMDGLAKSTDLVFVLAASNLPWYVCVCECAACWPSESLSWILIGRAREGK